MRPEWIREELAASRRHNGLRELWPLESAVGARVTLDGRQLRNFSSNDYLGLASHPGVRQGAKQAVDQWGAGAGASRLITGSLGIHGMLEHRLAALKGTESCILFSTGYQANLGIITALMPSGVIFSDALNHASIVDGCRLAKARTVIYRHLDTAHLESLMKAHADAPRKMIVTDGVFSMDGDLAPLPELVKLAKTHKAMLVVDDAHATGVMGAGAGTAHHFGLREEVDIQMGTLGKALGSFGAFVATSRLIRQYLVNRARSLIYTTAPAPPAVGAALGALDVLEQDPDRCRRLGENAAYARTGLRQAGFNVPDDPTPIIPLVLGGNLRTLKWGDMLNKRGFWVHPIRPPTVAADSSRLRIALTSEHTREDIDDLVDTLTEIAQGEQEN